MKPTSNYPKDPKKQNEDHNEGDGEDSGTRGAKKGKNKQNWTAAEEVMSTTSK